MQSNTVPHLVDIDAENVEDIERTVLESNQYIKHLNAGSSSLVLLLHAIQNNDLDSVIKLLEHREVIAIINEKASDGDITPILSAIHAGNLNIVKTLHEHGATLTDTELTAAQALGRHEIEFYILQQQTK